MKRGLFERSPLNRGMRGGMASRIIGPWDWILAPALISLAATIVLATAFQPLGLYLPEPVTPLLLAFAWPLIRPSYIAPFVLGGLGIFLDFFWGAPLGFWTLNLMLVYAVLVFARTYIIGQDWLVVFGVFLLTELVFFGLCTVVMSIDTGSVPRLFGVFEQAFATTLFFPAVWYLMEKYLHADVRFQ
ncbi:membrane protein [Asticcacaulis sp. AC402]|nr:membrane protein [Asticcacaulis sp. AC402]